MINYWQKNQKQISNIFKINMMIITITIRMDIMMAMSMLIHLFRRLSNTKERMKLSRSLHKKMINKN